MWLSGLSLALALGMATGGKLVFAFADRATESAAREARLSESATLLASDEFEGRGPGTKGIDLAADYIAKQFADAGLKTDLYDGSPFQ